MQKDTENVENVDPKLLKTKIGKTMLLSKCALCSKKKSRFLKEQESKGLLSTLGIKKPFGNSPLLGKILFLIFLFEFIECNSFNFIVI